MIIQKEICFWLIFCHIRAAWVMHMWLTPFCVRQTLRRQKYFTLMNQLFLLLLLRLLIEANEIWYASLWSLFGLVLFLFKKYVLCMTAHLSSCTCTWENLWTCQHTKQEMREWFCAIGLSFLGHELPCHIHDIHALCLFVILRRTWQYSTIMTSVGK